MHGVPYPIRSMGRAPNPRSHQLRAVRAPGTPPVRRCVTPWYARHRRPHAASRHRMPGQSRHTRGLHPCPNGGTLTGRTRSRGQSGTGSGNRPSGSRHSRGNARPHRVADHAVPRSPVTGGAECRSRKRFLARTQRVAESNPVRLAAGSPPQLAPCLLRGPAPGLDKKGRLHVRGSHSAVQCT